MDSPKVTHLEPFHPIDWDPGTRLVLQVFDGYDDCLRRLRPYLLYLLQLRDANSELIPAQLDQQLKVLHDQFQASLGVKVSTKRNVVTRRGHRLAWKIFEQMRQLRIEFDELTIKRVVEVIKQKHTANQRREADPGLAESEEAIVIPVDPSKWDEDYNARILSITRNSPDHVQAALVWIRDALAIYQDLLPAEQAESLIELYAEWKENCSDPNIWVKMHLFPSQRKLVGDLRDRVMELKSSIARKQDELLQLEEEQRAQYAQRQQEVVEATAEVLHRQRASSGWQFRETGADADESLAFEDSPPSSAI